MNPGIITLSSGAVFALPIIIGVLVVLYGAFVFIREHGSRLGRRYFFFSASVGLYVVAAGISYVVFERDVSLFWDHVAHIGVTHIPIALYVSSISLVGYTARKRRVGQVLLATTALFLVFLLASDQFIQTNRRLGSVYYPEYGIIGYVFIAYFAVVAAVVIYAIARQRSRSRDPMARRRLGLVAIATIIGLGGAIDFLPAIGLSVVPVGYIPIAVFVLVMGYAITRFRLVDVTPATAASAILKTMPGGVIVLDRDGTVRVANPAAGALLQTTPAQVVDRRLSDLVKEFPPLSAFLDIDSEQSDVEVLWDVDGESKALSVSCAPLTDGSKTRMGTVFVFRDISDKKRTEQELQYLALHDSLTGLPNRKLFFDRIEQQTLLAERNARSIAVLYIDLDGFKDINDSYGHEAGDAVLRITAARITSSVRSSDTVARLGGDEFAVILAEIHSAQDVSSIIGSVSKAIHEPVQLESSRITLGASIGAAIWPEDATTVESLISIADARMYEWKKRR